MAEPFTGGCACGAVRYAIEGEPVFQNHCQCLDCRKRSGTGHGSYATFAGRPSMTITGEPVTWRVASDSGNDKIHAFCPTCGTPVWLTFAAMPHLVAVHAGSLDQPDQFRPQAVTYRVRALSWDTLDPALPAFERMP